MSRRKNILFLSTVLLLFGRPAAANYAVFDQTTDTISIPGNTVVGTTMTLEAIIRFSSSVPPSSYYSLLFNEQYSGAEDKRLDAGTQGFGGITYKGDPAFLYTHFVDMVRNKWHHIALVCDGAAERLYLNGVLRGTRGIVGTIKNSGLSVMSIGAFQEPGPPFGFRNSFIGDIEALRISSTARYSGMTFTPPMAGFISDGATLLLYNFEESPGSTTALDSGPNGWNGAFGVGFAGATSPAIVNTATSTRYLRSTGTATGTGEITVEMLTKPAFPRGAGPMSPQVMETVSVTIPSGFTEMQTAAMMVDSLNDQLSAGYIAALYDGNTVSLWHGASYTMGLVETVPGQTIQEIAEPPIPPGIPTLTEWGMILLALSFAATGAVLVRRRGDRKPVST